MINYIKTKKLKENYYIIGDYYYGRLEDFIQIDQKKISIKEIQLILLDICKAFKWLNDKNLIYSDIKP